MGFASSTIDAVWPRWWSAEADESASARAELRFGIARRLGLNPRTLLDDRDRPEFLWREEARFKHLTAADETERAGIESFGRSVAAAIASATGPPSADVRGWSPAEIRDLLLRDEKPYVGLTDLLALCWGIGIPVVYLRVFPWPQKRMAAMTVRIENRSFILLGKDASYPAPIAFYVAHELGHIVLSHIAPDEALVDMDAGDPVMPVGDDEEAAADAFALELLTGWPEPKVLPAEPGTQSAGELARTAKRQERSCGSSRHVGAVLRPSTGDWRPLTHRSSASTMSLGRCGTGRSRGIAGARLGDALRTLRLHRGSPGRGDGERSVSDTTSGVEVAVDNDILIKAASYGLTGEFWRVRAAPGSSGPPGSWLRAG